MSDLWRLGDEPSTAELEARAVDDERANEPTPIIPIGHLPDSYWIAFLAATLMNVTLARSGKLARDIARESLAKLVDPIHGIRAIPEDIRLRWRIAATRKEPEDE